MFRLNLTFWLFLSDSLLLLNIFFNPFFFFKRNQQTVISIFFTPSPAAQPVLFKNPLQQLERQAGESASLCCETTKPGACVVWRFGDKVLASSSKYHLKQEGTSVELVVYKLQAADSGEYSCDTGSQRTSAVLSVWGRSCSLEDRASHSPP